MSVSAPVSYSSSASVMTSTGYRNALRRLYALNTFHPKGAGTTQMDALYKKIGEPLDVLPVIHIAGTNGKGSVSVKVADILRRSGLRVGLFTSPHISSFRERIQVNGVCIEESVVEKHLSELFELTAAAGLKSTFFELVTALGCLQFRDEQCDVVVLEVGLGGRLDATNSVYTALSVITSIQFDHTNVLGNSLAEIATEKCGIFRMMTPALIGPQVPFSVAQRIAESHGTPLYQLGHILPGYKHGAAQWVGADPEEINRNIARATALLFKSHYFLTPMSDLSDEDFEIAVKEGLEARPPCRFEIFKVQTRRPGNAMKVIKILPNEIVTANAQLVLFDIAHNEAAISAMVLKLKERFAGWNIRFVFGMCKEKDVASCIKQLLHIVTPDRIHCVQAASPRALSANQLSTMVHQEAITMGIASFKDSPMEKTVGRAVRESLRLLSIEGSSHSTAAETKGTLVVVCGSAFLMSEARAAVGIIEPRD